MTLYGMKDHHNPIFALALDPFRLMEITQSAIAFIVVLLWFLRIVYYSQINSCGDIAYHSLRAIQVPPEGHYVHPECSAKKRNPGSDGCIQSLWVWREGSGEYSLPPQVICRERLQGVGTTVTIYHWTLPVGCSEASVAVAVQGLYLNLLQYSHLNCVLHVGVCGRGDTCQHVDTHSFFIGVHRSPLKDGHCALIQPITCKAVSRILTLSTHLIASSEHKLCNSHKRQGGL